MKRGDGGSDFIDHADALMTQNAAGRTSRHVAFKDVQIGSADRCLDDFDEGVRRRGNLRHRTIFDGFFPRSVIDECLHRCSP